MDKHIVPGVTLKDATEAHKMDIALQHEFDCKAITIWLDEGRGCVFCLIEAPSKQAVRELHDKAHGSIPNEIIEVEESLVMAFLGRINDPKPYKMDSEQAEIIFYDPAYRAIMAIKVKEVALISSRYGKEGGNHQFELLNNIIEDTVKKYRGREVLKSRDGYLISFDSPSKSMNCAVDIESIAINEKIRSDINLDIAIGISGGDPVSGKKDLFCESTRLASYLCYLSGENGKIIVSSEITEKIGINRLHILSEKHPIKSLSNIEERFFISLMEIMEDCWDNPETTLLDICKQAGFSRSMLYRNITSLTGKSFVDFLKEFRLKRALILLEKNKDHITRAAFESGFSNPSYFAKCFKDRFGILPSDYIKSIR